MTQRYDDVVLRLVHMLQSTQTRPAIETGCRALIWRLSTHPKQERDGQHYMEISIGYLQRVSGVSFGSSRTAWHLVAEALQWTVIHKRDVEPMGFSIRKIRRGQRWGQHVLLTDEQVRAIGSIARWLIDEGLWTPFPLSMENEWRLIRVSSRGSRLQAHCPWHEDRVASMSMNLNDDDPSTGWAVCHACVDGNGNRLTAFARKTNGRWEARLSRRTQGAEAATNTPAISVTCALDGIHNPLVGHGAGRVILGRLDGHGLSGSFAKRDLLETLRWADRCGPTAEREAWTAAAMYGTSMDPDSPTQYLPDRLVSIGRMRASEWRAIKSGDREVFVPSRFRPVSQRWILFDMDGMDPMRDLRTRKARLRKIVTQAMQATKWLGNEHAVVQTSNTGIHVWMSLQQPQEAHTLFSASSRSRMRRLGKHLIGSFHDEGITGGRVDETAFAAGRYGRRPGWRLLEDGEPYRVRLIDCSEI